MKKLLLTTFLVVTFFTISAVSASAVVNDMVKVGLRYGSSALFSANLENAVGEGYSFGFFDDDRTFCEIGATDETAISMTAAGDIYMNADGTYSPELSEDSIDYLGCWHVQIDDIDDYDDAVAVAEQLDGYPAWINGEYVVRVGNFDSEDEATYFAEALGGGTVEKSSSTSVVVTETRTTNVLFEFDYSGVLSFGVMPDGEREEAVTWFKGYKYCGGFEYPRVTGGNLHVYNVVDLETYVKGVIPYEMNNTWPLAALEAQAICARTYASRNSKHLSSYGFDVCNTTDCQVYYGVSGGSNGPNANTNRAVDNTEGMLLYYNGDMIQNAVYHSSNGGATEDVFHVWGSTKGYLVGKEDPYEGTIDIPNYNWSVIYTAEELTWILEQKEYNIGRVKDVYVSEYTDLGNVKEVTFEGSRSTLKVTGETCRTIFYSSTYNKSVKSMRFGINGSGPAKNTSTIYINDTDTGLRSLEGVAVLSGNGTLTKLSGESFVVLSSSGKNTIAGGGESSASKPSNNNKKDGIFVIEGSGSGHNLGMSQYGARAMAEMGYDYEEILKFYFTNVTIE